jgi:hypothetical protein
MIKIKFYTRIVLFAVIFALSIFPIVSCSGAGNDNENNENNENIEQANQDDPAAEKEEPNKENPENPDFPDLPEADFADYEFRILNTGEDHEPWVLKTMVPEQFKGEILNDSILMRNRRMEDRFGFKLIQIDCDGPGDVQIKARNSINSNLDDFDLAMTTTTNAIVLAQEGLLQVISGIPHVDLSQPWWDQDMVREFSIGGRVYFANNDFSLSQYSVTIPLFFNKKIADDLGLESPYRLVREGRWTIDKFAEMGRTALKDMNGDSIYDQHDQWGLASFPHVYTFTLMAGMGSRYVIKDEDDIPVLNTRSEGVIDRFFTLYDSLIGWLWDYERPNTPVNPNYLFLNDQVLFLIELMNMATHFRAMESDFGILPPPKFNEQQENYLTGIGEPYLKCVPVTSVDLARTGIILEAMGAESRNSTLRAYLDTMLVYKVVNRDEESAEMLDIIFANRVYDLGRQYWNEMTAQWFANAVRDMRRDIVSVLERVEQRANTAIEITLEAFLEN